MTFYGPPGHTSRGASGASLGRGLQSANDGGPKLPGSPKLPDRVVLHIAWYYHGRSTVPWYHGTTMVHKLYYGIDRVGAYMEIRVIYLLRTIRWK